MDRKTLGAALRLARWLGPWTPEAAVPKRVHRRTLKLGATAQAPEMSAWVYRPTGRIDGALLVVPGLHYAGPADPRLDRFCRVLASARMLVLAPFLPDFTRMRVDPTLTRDAERALDALLDLPEYPRHIRPGVFSISFGSLPAMELAARRPEVGALMLFGGYADFRETIRFSLLGAPGRPHDPLNQCVVFMNLLEHLSANDPEQLNGAWFEFIRATWGRPHMKERSAYLPVAHRIADRLNCDRELFLIGTGVLEGGEQRMDAALAHKAVAHLDPLPWARQVRCPTVISHGRDDDVIPFEHAEILATAMPHARVWLTGMYSHTGPSGVIDLLGVLPREIGALIGIVGGMAKTSRGL